MARWRCTLAFILLLVWTATPALACLPSPTMTQAEMACCKKMAGDCHMGSNNHPCCKRVSSVDPLVPKIQPIPQVQPDLSAVTSVYIQQVSPSGDFVLTQVGLGLPPPAPPGPNSILRI